jgi:hypothetical protein
VGILERRQHVRDEGPDGIRSPIVSRSRVYGVRSPRPGRGAGKSVRFENFDVRSSRLDQYSIDSEPILASPSDPGPARGMSP